MSEEKNQKRFLTRAEILEVEDRPIEDVHTPEWGGWTRVRGMTGLQRDKLEDDVNKKDGSKTLSGVRPRVASLCIVNEDGSRMYTEADIPALGKRSAAALSRVCDVAFRLSGMDKKAVEEIEGNSTAQSDDSTSD